MPPKINKPRSFYDSVRKACDHLYRECEKAGVHQAALGQACAASCAEDGDVSYSLNNLCWFLAGVASQVEDPKLHSLWEWAERIESFLDRKEDDFE